MPCRMTNQKFLLLFTFLYLLLQIQTINSDAEVDAKSSLTVHERIRRRVYGFYHHPEFVASAESGSGNRRASSLDDKPSKFQLKCPRTSNKNISSVTWSLNGQTLFTVNFAEDGRLEVVQSVADWQVEEKVWRALEDHFGMILAAKKGRYMVEVENGGPRGQWIMLRINEPNLEEDQGEWKCQVFINDKGIVRLEAESRKRIEEKIGPRKAREFSRTAPMRVDAKSRWEMWQNRLLEGRTFGFAKSDGEFAVFERVESAGNAGIGQPLIGDSIEYTRNDSPRSAPAAAAKDKLEDDEEEEDISMNSPWRWRRARSGEDRGVLALPLPLITGLLIQLLIAFI